MAKEIHFKELKATTKKCDQRKAKKPRSFPTPTPFHSRPGADFTTAFQPLLRGLSGFAFGLFLLQAKKGKKGPLRRRRRRRRQF
jgi:hypothetical protein